MARIGRALARPREAARTTVSDRIRGGLERQLTRALERRLGGPPSRREPGAFERRLVSVLQRRRHAGRPPAEVRPLRRVRATLQHWRPGGGAPARRTTVRALGVSILARSLVRTVAVLVRILLSGPTRRLARVLARRAIRARPMHHAGFLALLLAAIAVLVRALAGPRGAATQVRRTAVLLALRVLRTLLPMVGRLTLRLGRTFGALLVRAARWGLARRRAA